jgi:hypothetical protein
MRKRKCECPTCKALIDQEFFAIVGNPLNGRTPQNTQTAKSDPVTLQDLLDEWRNDNSTLKRV